MLKIQGYGDDLTVNNIRIGDLSPAEHEKIELERGGKNYKSLENVVVSHVQDSSTLICRKPSKNGVDSYIEEELIDGLCCYSAVNQGQLNKTIVDAVVKHLTEEKIPTVPRSIRHKYMSAFLMATTSITEMDRVVPKVAGVEAPELMFKLSRRWGYEVKGIPENEAIIVAAKGNFHGRTVTAVSMSDDPDSRENFGPFVPGIELIPFNDIDALVMGRNTFEMVLSFDVDWPYSKPVFVLTNTLTQVPEGFEGKVFIVNGELLNIVKNLNQLGYHNLYIDGGKTIQSFLAQDLIDELILTRIPILLGGGFPLFGALPEPLGFKLLATKKYIDTVVQNHYIRDRE